MLKRADELNQKRQYGAEIDILNVLITNEPDNVLLYTRRGNAWRRFKNDDQGAFNDFNTAIEKIESKKYKYDLTQYYNNDKKNEHCTIYDVVQLYKSRAELYENTKKLDLAIKDYSKAIGFFFNANGDYVKYPDHYSGADEYSDISSLLYFRADLYQQTGQYEAALGDHNKRIAIAERHRPDDYLERSSFNYINGNYAEAIADLQGAGMDEIGLVTENFKNTDLNYPKYFFNYLSSLIALRRFKDAGNLYKKYIKLTYNEYTQTFDADVVFHYTILKKGEPSNVCERLDTTDVVYSFHNYYKCILNSIAKKNYQEALSRIDIQERAFKNQLLSPSNKAVTYPISNWYLMASNLSSLKGYLLTKLNRSAEAKEAFKNTLAVNPNAKEAIKELSELK